MISTADLVMQDHRTGVLVVPRAEEAAEAGPPAQQVVSTTQQMREVFAVNWTVDDAWFGYLAQFANRHLARAVATFFQNARALGGAALLPVPTAIPSEDGSMHLAWDREQHHLDVDLFPDGSFEWFYRNRLTDELDGTDESRVFGMPDALARRIRLIAR